MHLLQNFDRGSEAKAAYGYGEMNLLFYHLPRNFSDEYKSYDAPRLCTIIEGKKEVTINDSNSFVYQRDRFVLLPPHSTVYMFIPEKTRALVYEFSDKLIDSVYDKISIDLDCHLSEAIKYDSFLINEMTKQIEGLEHRILDILNGQDDNKEFLMDLACRELVYHLMKIPGGHEIIHHHHYHPVNKAVRLINQHLEDELSIQEIADAVHLSASNFSQQFKLVMEQTPLEYMIHQKLNYAKELLKDQSVTETAYCLGYQNISYFIRRFKNEFGLTPKQYQMSR